MKLAKRISIALLAACVVGGSALAMTACGGGSVDYRNGYVAQFPDAPFVESYERAAAIACEEEGYDSYSLQWYDGWDFSDPTILGHSLWLQGSEVPFGCRLELLGADLTDPYRFHKYEDSLIEIYFVYNPENNQILARAALSRYPDGSVDIWNPENVHGEAIEVLGYLGQLQFDN